MEELIIMKQHLITVLLLFTFSPYAFLNAVNARNKKLIWLSMIIVTDNEIAYQKSAFYIQILI